MADTTAGQMANARRSLLCEQARDAKRKAGSCRFFIPNGTPRRTIAIRCMINLRGGIHHQNDFGSKRPGGFIQLSGVQRCFCREQFCV